MMHPEHVCVDELASGDLDELQKIMKVREELKQLQESRPLSRAKMWAMCFPHRVGQACEQ